MVYNIKQTWWKGLGMCWTSAPNWQQKNNFSEKIEFIILKKKFDNSPRSRPWKIPRGFLYLDHTFLFLLTVSMTFSISWSGIVLGLEKKRGVILDPNSIVRSQSGVDCPSPPPQHTNEGLAYTTRCHQATTAYYITWHADHWPTAPVKGKPRSM